jgi:mono/diheme cytochrome c family protein
MTITDEPPEEPSYRGKIILALIIVVVLAAVLLLVTVFAGRAPIDHVPEDPPGVVDGQQVYARYCQVCHGRDGKGSPGRNPPLTDEQWLGGEVPILVTLHGLHGPMEIDGVSYSGMMPPMGHILSNAEIAAVLTYVRSSFGNELGPVSREDVVRVREAHEPTRGPWSPAELLDR